MLFDQPVSSTAADVVAGVAGVTLLVLAVRMWGRRGPAEYHPADAWLRAGLYFAGCLVLARLLGVLPTVLGGPSGDTTQRGFWWAVTGCLAVEVVAYGVIWPRGTLTHGRQLRPGWQAGFGLAWGISESLWFLTIWAIVEQFVSNPWATAALSFVAISAFTGIWHDRYWDIYVAPEHNIVEWNPRKVLLCHVPNLVATLAFLAAYGAVRWFVVFQTVALVLSVFAMRFPAPTDTAAIAQLNRSAR